MEYPKIENLNSNTCTERSIKLHYLEFWNYLITKYDNITWPERLYWFYHDLSEHPKCPVCGGLPGFINFKKGYKTYCSSKCSNGDKSKIEKVKQTNQDRYGGTGYSSKYIYDKVKLTNQERYGCDNPMQNKCIAKKSQTTNINRYGGIGNASEKIFKKQMSTMIGRYQVDNAMKSEQIMELRKDNCFKKNGVSHPSKIDKIKHKIQKSRRDFEINRLDFLIGYTENGDWICKCPHPGCNNCKNKSFIIPPLRYEGRIKECTEICTVLNPIGIDYTKGSYPEHLIRNILDDNNVEYFTNNRSIICPKELDIYIPSKNIAIECNGVYWHSKKDSIYHINKYKQCVLKGTHMISIWEDWLKTDKIHIIKSILLNKLGLINNSIYARKTIIKELDSKVCNKFLDDNHIQGRSSACVKLGLYYNDELVSVMTFSKPRVNMGGKKHKCEWELVRFCNKLNTRVVGGASKLLKHFIKTYNPTSIVSFSMNDISDGNLYKQLGFETDGKITHSYWYIEPGTFKRYHRSSFTKQSIVERGWKDKVDNTWTERQAMEEQGYFCIYDSGQLKWILNLKN